MSEQVLRRYFAAALMMYYAMRRLLQQEHYDVVVLHHGIYVPQGITAAVCRKEGIRIVTWNPAYRRGCFIFSHKDTYHHTLMSEQVDGWETMSMSQKMHQELKGYLKSRWYGTKDWIWFHEKPEVNLDSIRREIGLDSTKPCIGMLSNVMWDAQLHYPVNIFRNMMEWVFETISYFEKRDDMQLILRVHPAEIRGAIPSRQSIIAEVIKKYPLLPKNISIIPPESRISTYAVMMQCNAVIIYGTKTGVELVSNGIPVIVAGEAWIRGKGLTIDPVSKQDYFASLDRLPLKERLSIETVERARRYAYHFFFKRMIPVKYAQSKTGGIMKIPYTMNIETLKDLLPGNDLGLDVICNGIMNAEEFIYPHEYRE